MQQAAEIGLYGLDFLMNSFGDPTGLTLPVAIEELFWGDAGIGMAIMGSALAAAGISGNGTPEQVIEWIPQCYGTADDVKLGAFCVSEPDAGSDVSSLRTRAVYDEANDEWVHQRHEGVDHQRWHRRRARGGRRGRARRSRVVGQASFIVPPNTKGLSQGQKYKKHGIRASHTAEVVLDDVRVPGQLPARWQGEAGREVGTCPRAWTQRREAAGDGHLRGHPPVGGRAGVGHRPCRVRVRARVREGASRRSASRSS